jgi:pimeloyl-ACP methyl ester carboxylesterase
VPFAAGLYYEERGSGPPVVLSHGVIESSTSFAPLAERLAGRFRVIAYDARARGRSRDGPVDYPRLAEDVAALAATLGLGRFGHVGHSMGGRVALEHAVAHPQEVRALAIMSARAEAPDERGRERLRALIERTRREGPGVAVDAWIDRADPLYGQVSAISAANDRGGTIAALECLVRMGSFVERLGEVGAPALVIVGDRDEAYVRSALIMAERIPRAELVVLPGVGHFPNLEVADVLAERLGAFLGRGACG